MIVHNLYVHGIRLSPTEADSPLVVYPNAVLTYPIASEGLQPVPRNRSEIGNNFRRMDPAYASRCEQCAGTGG
jgi:hypothetical protein